MAEYSISVNKRWYKIYFRDGNHYQDDKNRTGANIKHVCNIEDKIKFRDLLKQKNRFLYTNRNKTTSVKLITDKLFFSYLDLYDEDDETIRKIILSDAHRGIIYLLPKPYKKIIDSVIAVDESMIKRFFYYHTIYTQTIDLRQEKNRETIKKQLIDSANHPEVQYILPEDCSALFYRERIQFTALGSNWNTSYVHNMQAMFAGNCQGFFLDCNNWDTSNVTDMSFLFSSNSGISTFGIEHWNVSKVTTMHGMFRKHKLHSIDDGSVAVLDLNHWDMRNVKNIDEMFLKIDCNLRIRLENWRLDNIKKVNFFIGKDINKYCRKIKKVINSPIINDKIVKVVNILNDAAANEIKTIFDDFSIWHTIPANTFYQILNHQQLNSKTKNILLKMQNKNLYLTCIIIWNTANVFYFLALKDISNEIKWQAIVYSDWTLEYPGSIALSEIEQTVNYRPEEFSAVYDFLANSFSVQWRKFIYLHNKHEKKFSELKYTLPIRNSFRNISQKVKNAILTDNMLKVLLAMHFSKNKISSIFKFALYNNKVNVINRFINRFSERQLGVPAEFIMRIALSQLKREVAIAVAQAIDKKYPHTINSIDRFGNNLLWYTLYFCDMSSEAINRRVYTSYNTYRIEKYNFQQRLISNKLLVQFLIDHGVDQNHKNMMNCSFNDIVHYCDNPHKNIAGLTSIET